MKIKQLTIQNFRNLAWVDLKPESTFNVIYGINGSGKTSFLEAVSYLAMGRSFRSNKYQNLIRNGQQGFVVSGSIESDTPNHLDRIGIARSRGRDSNDLQISINGKHVNRLIDLINHICVQIIQPQGIDLITGGPEQRRSFIDWGVYYSNQDYQSIWFNYKKILQQRNMLLKMKASDEEISVWDDLLCNLSEKITTLRENYLNCLNAILSEKVNQFLPQFCFTFSLSRGWENRSELRSLLRSSLERDKLLGYTFYGCHRADIKIRCDQNLASETLSRGQLKLLVCAMRLSQGTLLQLQHNKSCIYLIDDLSSELDAHSKHILLSDLFRFKNQVFITNISKDLDVPDTDSCNFINIAESIQDF